MRIQFSRDLHRIRPQRHHTECRRHSVCPDKIRALLHRRCLYCAHLSERTKSQNHEQVRLKRFLPMLRIYSCSLGMANNLWGIFRRIFWHCLRLLQWLQSQRQPKPNGAALELLLVEQHQQRVPICQWLWICLRNRQCPQWQC